MPSLRRLRAILVMMFLWGLSAAILGAVFGVGTWFFSGRAQNVLFWDEVILVSLLFTSAGVLGGAGFALILSSRGQNREVDALPKRSGLLWWIGVGAVAGMIGYLFMLWANASLWTLTYHSILIRAWTSVLIAGGVFGLVGGGVGTGILAIARRGKALPSAEEHSSISDGSKQ